MSSPALGLHELEGGLVAVADVELDDALVELAFAELLAEFFAGALVAGLGVGLRRPVRRGRRASWWCLGGGGDLGVRLLAGGRAG